MSQFDVGSVVIWKKKECIITEIQKGKKTNKLDYQNGVMPNGFKSEAKKYILSDGSSVTGQQLITHKKHLQNHE